jgi:hypothetical protein
MRETSERSGNDDVASRDDLSSRVEISKDDHRAGGLDPLPRAEGPVDHLGLGRNDMTAGRAELEGALPAHLEEDLQDLQLQGTCNLHSQEARGELNKGFAQLFRLLHAIEAQGESLEGSADAHRDLFYRAALARESGIGWMWTSL